MKQNQALKAKTHQEYLENEARVRDTIAKKVILSTYNHFEILFRMKRLEN